MIKPQVDLVPVNPAQDFKIMEKMHKLMKKRKPEQFSGEELESEQEEPMKIIEGGMNIYWEEQKRDVIHDVLTAKMGAEPD